MRRALAPISWLYGIGVATRNAAFDRGLLLRERVPVPVISVGNLTVGGTGKTPLVEYLVSRLLERAQQVAVVSRGYGRRSKGVVVVSDNGRVLADARAGGDEPVQIARKFPLASVVVGERRVEAARVALGRCGAGVILMDDGFQHRYLERDLDIVVIDARTPLAGEPMLPAGKRREQLSALGRADLLAFSHAERTCDPPWVLALEGFSHAESFAFRSMIRGYAMVTDQSPIDRDSLTGRRFYVFSGIGDHRSFLDDLRHAGLGVVGERHFGDHHRFRTKDIDQILDASNSSGAEACMTTEKDMVRMISDPEIHRRLGGQIPFMFAMAAVEVLRGASVLESALDRVLTSGRSS